MKTGSGLPAPDATPTEDDRNMLDRVVAEGFPYFVEQANPDNGLVRDKTDPAAPASIAVVGLALTCYAAGVERGLWSRGDAVERSLATLRFFHQSPQSRASDATGYRGFYYHFLDMATGRRAWNCELSTIDTALFIAGALFAAEYFDRDDEKEAQIRRLADLLYRRIDWTWALNRGATVSHGWKPETGFLPCSWEGYSEGLLLYALALGSPTHPLGVESYQAWGSSYSWKKIYGTQLLYAGPLFIHQLPHVWIDLRAIQDDFVGRHGIDYFENSRRATLVQQEYAIRNPRQLRDYNERCWGITASDGPGPAMRKVDGIERRFYGYLARGAPFGPDDGTMSPWAVVASLPFAPEIVVPTMRYLIENVRLKERQEYGFDASFNATFPERTKCPFGWVSPWVFGLNQGPIVLMIENFSSELVWSRMRRCRYLVAGLRKAGFRGGWLA